MPIAESHWHAAGCAGCTSQTVPRLGPTLAGLEKLDSLPDDVIVHLDRGYDRATSRALLDALGFDGAIASKGVPAPIQAGSLWVVERAHSWMNSYGKLRRCTEQRALVFLRQLIQRARFRYRWPSRPTARRLK